MMDELEPESFPPLDEAPIPGPTKAVESPVMAATNPELWALHQHGLAKGSMMLLGLEHHHDGDDLVITTGWEALLEGLGFSSEGETPMRRMNGKKVTAERIDALRRAKHVLEDERRRRDWLEKERTTIRIAAETGARQRGLGIAETDRVGKNAAASVFDGGPENPAGYLAAQRLEVNTP